MHIWGHISPMAYFFGCGLTQSHLVALQMADHAGGCIGRSGDIKFLLKIKQGNLFYIHPAIAEPLLPQFMIIPKPIFSPLKGGGAASPAELPPDPPDPKSHPTMKANPNTVATKCVFCPFLRAIGASRLLPSSAELHAYSIY